jgi:lipoyl(octanoyl) transferase
MEEVRFPTELIPSDAEVIQTENQLILTKWIWEFKDCEAFQEKARDFVEKHKNYKIYIFTNHPHVFTLGRGNERGRDDLKAFDESLMTSLPYPVHKIHRGGGITFHYPGQWIAYPIVAVNKNYTLDDHMCWLLKNTKALLTDDFKIENVITAQKLMGVWKDKKKLASIGVGLKKFVTLHGLALNLEYDEEMFNALKLINPCGMDGETYICADQFIKEDNLLEKFHKIFIQKLISKELAHPC